MKIGLMGGWNSDSGAAFHTELVGRSWVKSGHKVTVFSFYPYSFHGTNIVGKDEDYVHRCFTTCNGNPQLLNPVPFLTSDYEIFVAEDHGMFPNDLLGKIFHWIKRRAKTVAVIHDGKLAENPSFYQFQWDAIVSFDQRYMDFLKKGYEPKLVHMIPYPCHPMQKGDKSKARKKLRLPKDNKIIYMFGPSAKKALDTIFTIDKLAAKYPVLLLVTTKDKESLARFGEMKSFARNVKIQIRKEAPDVNGLYDYLHAADVMIFGKQPTGHVVVSSTVFQCMGSGCPIIARASNYVSEFKKALMQYANMGELEKHLTSIFEKSTIAVDTVANAEKYVRANSAEIIAAKFIDLFKELKKT